MLIKAPLTLALGGGDQRQHNDNVVTRYLLSGRVCR